MRWASAFNTKNVTIPPQTRFAKFICYRSYAEPIPDVLVADSMEPSYSNHPAQHHHLHCDEATFYFLGRGPIFSTIESNGRDNSTIDLRSKSVPDGLVTLKSGQRAPLPPCGVNPSNNFVTKASVR
ncbi:hypothetical protein Y032_0600g485 [Ancylostoma ceylanicum]|uniref:Uncharacterized protein n=1 Tax=Ancylostoma ceylanicum TaxID=53326 RepID=A0A016WLL3_9BILA|nr:hypothetical protein Y032_0600g485 [Ancylostoma ceylanicum]